ncbi:MAG TPA: carbonic anhydrase [Tepidisphaeraceae bacterium]|nr:carbonic anhydrase [Tepidisphaeraceae bacterium]
MSLLQDILSHNEAFVAAKEYANYLTDRFPNKKMVVLTCMDTRLVELLPRAMNFGQGDVKIIKIAGAQVSHPFGSAMRSILVAVYELGATEVFVVGHHGCGMTGLSCDAILQKARDRGVSEKMLKTLAHAGIDLKNWLRGFDSVEGSVRGSVEIIRNHPLLPRDIVVHGLIMDPETGSLNLLTDGYTAAS